MEICKIVAAGSRLLVDLLLVCGVLRITRIISDLEKAFKKKSMVISFLNLQYLFHGKQNTPQGVEIMLSANIHLSDISEKERQPKNSTRYSELFLL